MKADTAELRTFLTDELGEDSDLEGKSRGYLKLKTQMELGDKLPSDLEPDEVTADFLKGWKTHKQALENGKLETEKVRDTSIEGMPEYIKRKRDRATSEAFLSGGSNTLREKAIAQVARDDDEEVGAMSEKDRKEYISQNLKEIESKRKQLTDNLASEIRQG